MRVIGLSGYPGSGKDTAALALLGRGWQRLAFGDRLKQGALAIDPIVGYQPPAWWKSVIGRAGPFREIRLSEAIRRYGSERAKRRFPEIRRIYQRYGTEGGRQIHGDDCWLRIVADQLLKLAEASIPGVVITDVRFADEYDLVKSWSGSVYYIERSSLADYVATHRSESYPFPFDAKIVNDWGVDRLHADLLGLVGEP